MTNAKLKTVITRGNVTDDELYDILCGPGSGNDEQHNKVHVVCGGVKITDIEWYPHRSMGRHEKLDGQWVLIKDIPEGVFYLVWDHTGQSTQINRDMVLQLLDDIADRAASRACREVENQERHGSTKTLPKGWSIDSDGETINQFGDAV